MTRNTNQTGEACGTGAESYRGAFRASAVRAAWMTVGAALLVVMLFLTTGTIRFSQTGQELMISLIYSAFIALPSMVLLTRLAERYTDRFPRLMILLEALALICTAVFGCLVTGAILQFTGLAARGTYWREFRFAAPIATVITLIVGLSIMTWETLHYRLQTAQLELRTRQMEQERANKLLAEARLSSLESSIHPHFLFNTLNSIAALIPTDPQRAEDTVGKLASLLRFSLNAQHSGLVPLAQELKVVRDYLEIETTRFGQRLRYEILVPESLGSVKVPALSLQTLVENSVKHVAAQRVEGASIEVAGSMEAGRIRLEVIDDGPGFSLGAVTPEHGLGNLLARLELLFGGEGRLDVIREQERTIVRISFPAEP
jgi:LytS/YehU family sensor histidine kinase